MHLGGHPGLGVGVQGGGRLDEHERGRLGQQRPGQGHALTLPAGQGPALLGDHPGQALAQGGQDIAGVGDPDGLDEPVVAGGLALLGADLLVDVGPGGAFGLGAHEVLQARRLRVGAAAHVEGLAQGPGEELGGGAGDDDAGAHLLQGHGGQWPARQGHGGAGVGEAPQARGQVGGDLRVGAHEGRHAALLQAQAAAGVHQVAADGVGGGRVQVEALHEAAGGRRHLQQAAQASGSDDGPGVVLYGAGEHPQRPGQVGGVAVEGDEPAGGEAAGHGHARRHPHDDGGEEPGQQHLEGHEGGLGGGHLDAAAPQLLGGVPVAAGEDVLPADAPQDPQPRHRVRGDRGDRGLGLALDGLPLLQGADDQGDDGRHQRHTQDDDEPQAHRGAQHEDGHDEEAGRRPQQGRQVLDEIAQVAGVGGDDGGDLTGGDLPGQVLAGGGDLPAHEPVDVEGGAHPGRHPEVGQHRVPDGVDDEQHQQQRADAPDAAVETVLDAGVQGLAQEGRHDRLDDVGGAGRQGRQGDRDGGASQQPAQKRPGPQGRGMGQWGVGSHGLQGPCSQGGQRGRDGRERPGGRFGHDRTRLSEGKPARQGERR